jgi:outer membrane protein assembly factor BamB
VLWRQDISSFLPLAVGNDQVYAVSNDSHIVAYNAINGDIVWTNDLLDLRNLGAPAVYKDYVLVIDEDDYLHILNQSDGSFVGRLKPSGDDFVSPIKVDGGRFYVLSGDGTLSAYGAQGN